MIYCILGYTGSGKDTVLDKLLPKTNIQKAISYTTRPIRDGEINGHNYHFVDDDFFIKEKENFIEIRKYEVWNGSTWHYGYHKNSFPCKNTDYFAIITPSGYKELCKYFRKSEIKCFYIESSDNIIETRLHIRGDDPKEIKRRLECDKKDFADFLKNEKYMKINNIDNIDVTVGIIKYLIENNL